MEQQEIVSLLNKALALEAASFLVYVTDVASPLLGPEDQAVRDLLERIASEEEAYADEILDLIEAEGGKPDQPIFDMNNVRYHYLSPEYCLKVCAEKLEANVAAFRKVVDDLAEDAEIHAALGRIADGKAKHLADIQGALSQTS
jgi:rubrerythrin